jgi:hypothetical protein
MGRYEPGLGMAEAEFIEGDDNHMQVRFRARPVAVSFVNNSRKITVTITPTDETKPLE